MSKVNGLLWKLQEDMEGVNQKLMLLQTCHLVWFLQQSNLCMIWGGIFFHSCWIIEMVTLVKVGTETNITCGLFVRRSGFEYKKSTVQRWRMYVSLKCRYLFGGLHHNVIINQKTTVRISITFETSDLTNITRSSVWLWNMFSILGKHYVKTEKFLKATLGLR
jgi:hypothetical protein